MRHAIRVIGRRTNNLISGNILGGATVKLIDAAGEANEIRDNMLL